MFSTRGRLLKTRNKGEKLSASLNLKIARLPPASAAAAASPNHFRLVPLPLNDLLLYETRSGANGMLCGCDPYISNGEEEKRKLGHVSYTISCIR